MALTFLSSKKTTAEVWRSSATAGSQSRKSVAVENFWEPPKKDERVSIVGATGSGKTVMGLFLLAMSKLYDSMPVIIIDYKRDDHIMKIPARVIDAGGPVPKVPGIYKIEASPFLSRDDPVDTFLRRVWDNGETGLFFDEAYMLPDRFGRTERGTLRALFTTGRSRHIPIISLTQRPVDVTRYNFSEASHHVIFRLTDKADEDTVRGRVPAKEFDRLFRSDETYLPDFHSLWYDVAKHASYEMEPAPSPREIIAELSRVASKTKWV